MKKSKISSAALQYTVTVFLALAMMGAFMSSFGSGFFMLLATLMTCPFTRNVGINFIRKKFGDKFPIDKIKGGVYTVVVIVFICIALSLSPTVETVDNNQVTQSGTESVQSETFIAENTASVEGSVAVTPSEESATPIEMPQPTIEASPPVEVKEEEFTASEMEVHFIDVGQGDATLIKIDGHSMLIDAGDNDKGTAVQLYLQKQGVEKLDYLILTHTDADHIGGADVIITKFEVDTVFMGEFQEEKETYEDLMNALEYKVLQYSTPKVSSVYELGNASFTIVAPNKTYADSNNGSIALVLEHGDNSFLFTGDCEEQAETDILANGLNVDCDVYKLGHHGSRTASSQAFLDAVAPTYGVISCADGNSYGHPHAEPLNNLRAMGVQIFRTDEQGSIIAYSNGTDITWNCAPSDTWKAGEAVVVPTPTPTEAPAPTPIPILEPVSETQESTEEKGAYAVNGKNGKIHIVGECPATEEGNKNAMKKPVYFDTYEEAERHSITIAPGQDKRRCGNCW